MRNVHNYESLYGFDLPIPALISEVVAMRIVSYFKRDHPDFTSLNDATTIDIFKMILTIVQPADKNLFYKYMDKYVEFPTLPRSYVATVSNFKLMYEALLLYRLNFTNTFDVCSLMNKSSCIPNIDNKEGGLIKLFLSKIPFKWGINTYNSWTRPKFTALQDFIMKFYFAVERENKMSLSVRASQAKFELSAKVFTPTNAVHQITTSQVIKSSGITKTDQDFEEDSADNLEQDIEDEMAKVGFVDDDDNLDEAFSPTFGKMRGSTVNQFSASTSKPPTSILKRSSPSESSPATPSTQLSSTNPCYKMLMEGTCNKKGCTFSHDSSVLRKAWSTVKAQLMSSKFKPNSVNFVADSAASDDDNLEE